VTHRDLIESGIMAGIRTVFLSSTGADLREYREAAFLALQELEDWKCVRMEDFGARAWDVDSFCRAEVKKCDLFIGIIGHRFGGAPNPPPITSPTTASRRR